MKAIDPRTGRRVAWAALVVPLALLLAGALTYARSDLRLLPGEATVLMQAQSLAVDRDLAYERLDFDRVLLQVAEPPDLELVSGSGGRRVTFDRPFPYALWLAPFVAWRPEVGFAVANALLLAAAAAWAARTLERTTGLFAPVWIATLVFATPVLPSVFRADGDVYLVSVLLAAVGFASHCSGPGEAVGEVGEEGRGRSSRPALAVGVCLALAGAWSFLWLFLPLALLFLWRRGDQRLAMLTGFGLASIFQALVQWWVGGGLHFVGAVRGTFTTATGFPYVDFSGIEWNATVHRLSSLHFDGAPVLSWGFDLALWAWNLLYLLLGRHLGLVPYAAVALVALVAVSAKGEPAEDDRRRHGLWIWLAVSAAAVVLLLVFRPFQLFAVSTLGAASLLPLVALAPVVRVTAPDTRAPRRAWIALVVCVTVTAVVAWPSWTSPRTPRQGAAPGALASSFLPYETSQQDLPGGPWEDVAGLRVRFLDGHGWGESRRDRLVMEAGRPARLLIASPEPLAGLVLDFGSEASTRLEVGGEGRLDELLLRPSGGVGFQITLDGGRRHAMWWSPSARWLYFLDLGFPADATREDAVPLPFQVAVVPESG